MTRLRTLIGGAVTTALAAMIISGPHQPIADTIELTSREQARSYGSEPFVITVKGRSVKRLYPGITRDLKLTLRNPYNFTLSVRSLRGEVVSTSKRRCKAESANLIARSYTGRLPLLIPPRSKVEAKTIPLYMPPAASSACQGATFTIKLTGTATKASR